MVGRETGFENSGFLCQSEISILCGGLKLLKGDWLPSAVNAPCQYPFGGATGIEDGANARSDRALQ